MKFETSGNDMTGNIINAMYVHFWLPTIEKEILSNPIPGKYSLQWCNIGHSRITLRSLSFFKKPRKVKHWKLLTGIPIGRSCNFQDVRITRKLINMKLKFVCRKKFQKNRKIIVCFGMIAVDLFSAIEKKE